MHSLSAAALGAALVLTGCGGTTSSTSAPAQHGGAAGAAAEHAADVAFLSGMRPHHEQAVVMSDLVLAADPPAAVAELARQVKAAQAPEIGQMGTMLAALGQPVDGGHGGGHGGGHTGGHGGMMSDAEMAALRGARGAEAARLYLQGMIAHHRGAVEASQVELRDGTYAPARDLAERIVASQTAEIARMQELLAA